MININLVKSISDKQVRDDIVRVFYGIVPCDGRTHSIDKLLSKENRIKDKGRSVRIYPSKR